MRTLCLYTCSTFATSARPLPSFETIPLGLSAVAAALGQAGHQVGLAVLTPGRRLRPALESALKQHDPRLICLSLTSTEFPLASQVVELARELAPDAFMLLGGAHPSLNPRQSLGLAGVDAVCVGEGDQAVKELAALLEAGEAPREVANLWIKNPDGGPAQENPTRPLVADLDSLPGLDYDLWRPWVMSLPRALPVPVGRGCPNQCAYCSNHALARLAKGRYVRFYSPERVGRDVVDLASRFPELGLVRLEAETLGVDLNYTLELARVLEAVNDSLGRRLGFGVNLAPTPKLSGNSELLQALRRAGCEHISLGLESGSERLRREMLRPPPYDNQEVVEFCALARQAGLNIQLWVMIGLPGETLADFRQTVEVARACRPSRIFLSFYHPIPGTELFNLARDQGLIPPDHLPLEWDRQRPELELQGFSLVQQRREFILFPYYAYQGSLSWPLRMGKCLGNALAAWPRVHALARRLLGRGL